MFYRQINLDRVEATYKQEMDRVTTEFAEKQAEWLSTNEKLKAALDIAEEKAKILMKAVVDLKEVRV